MMVVEVIKVFFWKRARKYGILLMSMLPGKYAFAEEKGTCIMIL